MRAQLELLRTKIGQLEQAFQDEERDRRSAERRARAAEHRVADLSRTLRLVAATVSPSGDGVASRATPAEVISLDWTLEYDGTGHTFRLRSTCARARFGSSTRPGGWSSSQRIRSSAIRAQLMIRIPQSVAAAVESENWSAFQVEVEVDDVWNGAALWIGKSR